MFRPKTMKTKIFHEKNTKTNLLYLKQKMLIWTIKIEEVQICFRFYDFFSSLVQFFLKFRIAKQILYPQEKKDTTGQSTIEVSKYL